VVFRKRAGYLGIPSLIFRKITERVEGINSGVSNYLNGQAVEVDSLANNAMISFNTIYGDGFASKHIVDQLVKYLPSPKVEQYEALSNTIPFI
jgi:UDP-N-acetylglucosamine 2-epimerase